MEWQVSFGQPVIVRTSGVFDVSDHRRMVEDIVGRVEWRPGLAILFDHRQLDFGAVRLGEMVAARDTHVAHDEQIGRGRTAILMKSLSDYGIGRQFEQLAEDQVAAEMRIFVNEQEAVAWLRA